MSNPFYNQSGTPAAGSPGTSAPMRLEFARIAAAFSMLPNPLVANGIVVVNAGATALTTSTAATLFSGFLASPGPIGITTPSSGAFTGIGVTGGIGMNGNLGVGGSATITGAVTIGGALTASTLTVLNAVTLFKTLTLSGSLTGTDAAFSGPVTLAGTLAITGATTIGGALILGSGGPTITTGTGVPASTQPKGSTYSRIDGGVGSTLYVSQGAGVWNAVAGV